MESIIDRAAVFAIKAHEGQTRRRNNTPYIVHPFEVAVIAASMTSDSEIIAAALLHDTVEDTDVTPQDIGENFGERVKALVASETEDKRDDLPPEQTWKIRKEESLSVLKNADRDVKIIWLSDKLSNMRSFYRDFLKVGDAIWNNFNQKDPKMQEWYYRTIAEYLKDLSEQTAYTEYVELLEKVFGGKDDKQR